MRPWTGSLTVPEALTALSNTPVASSTPAERPGWKTVRFQTTPPLPSYLLAMAVGEFDAAEAGTVGGPVAGGAGPADAGGVPMRFITPRGRAAESAYAASVTGPIVQRLEDYFGMPFPYAKLDSLAIPVTVSFGAMEHPGLVTYASNLLLARPGEQTRRFERGYTVTAAHELAHQWFGNLVTMAWWDDLWLNESFASWMEVRITDEVKPAWGYALEHQRARAQAMRADRLVSARRIQQPVRSDDDMGNLFDTITYQKGHSVLAMFEAWLGEQRFRDGVRRYMQRHAWGNARTADFLAALGETEPTLPDALRSFTQQPGIPLLRVTLDCPAGGRPQLKLAQQRLLPLGATGQSGAPQRWQIPLRVRTPAGDSRLLLREAEDTLALPDTDCPAWVQPNAGGQGYYRVAQGADALLRLAVAPGLGDAEVLALLDDAQGLHEAGELDSASLLALVQRFADHPRRQVVTQAAELLASLQRLVGPAQRDAYAARWQAAFGARARQLGWLAQPGEAEDDTLLRDRLLPWLADLGQDQALRAEARRLAGAWLVDRNALPAAQRGSVLEVAAIAADDALFDALLAATRSTPQRNERRDLLQALGQARAPAQAERARALLLSTALDLRETLWSVLGEQARHPDTRAAALTWWQQHQAALVKRMGRDEPAELPMLFSAGCSADEDRQLQRSFGPSAARYIGGQANLARARESVALCSAWKLRQPSGL
ncbi:MAG: peptidase M1 [Burkholderiales bacterium PBB5]|nr:MAG: peptidase M1 [Burkholderiales bacterium PBB5]